MRILGLMGAMELLAVFSDKSLQLIEVRIGRRITFGENAIWDFDVDFPAADIVEGLEKIDMHVQSRAYEIAIAEDQAWGMHAETVLVEIHEVADPLRGLRG
jgi:hypothetical protein